MFKNNQESIFRPNSQFSQKIWIPILIFGLMLSVSLLGILTRPTGLLAAFWPANAVLLGVFIRLPNVARYPSWIAAVAGYLFADMLTGSNLSISIVLTIGNLVGVSVAFLLFSRVSHTHQSLEHPISIVYLVAIITIASLASGLVGLIVNPNFFNGSSLDGGLYWFLTELVNYLTILPVILTIPSLKIIQSKFTRKNIPFKNNIQVFAPLIVLLLGLLLQILVGGPGALTFIVPGLLWCSLSYGVFFTASVTLFASIWSLLAFSMGHIHMNVDVGSHFSLESLRLGIALLSLAPLTVASVMFNRNQLLNKLEFTATHDQLTSALNRSGFNSEANNLISRVANAKKSISVLMLDIDRFKSINDQYGHASGDEVLATFSNLTLNSLRETDILGRLGGEEFAVVLPETNLSDAANVAQRICNAFSQHEFSFEKANKFKATVSIGLVTSTNHSATLSDLLKAADNNLYIAKESGRNMVITSVS